MKRYYVVLIALLTAVVLALSGCGAIVEAVLEELDNPEESTAEEPSRRTRENAAADREQEEPSPPPQAEEPQEEEASTEPVGLIYAGNDLNDLRVSTDLFSMTRSQLSQALCPIEEEPTDGYQSWLFYRLTDYSNSYAAYTHYSDDDDGPLEALLLSTGDLYDVGAFSLDELRGQLGGKLEVDTYYSEMEGGTVTNVSLRQNDVQVWFWGNEAQGYGAFVVMPDR